jgi:hypothetical protein
MTGILWNITATIVGLFATVAAIAVGVLLKSIKVDIGLFSKRLDKQDDKIVEMSEKQANCKVDCQRNTVSKEDWVRSEGYTRKEIKEVAQILNRMDGKLEIVGKLPEICGQIVREVAAQVGGGGKKQ